MATGIFKAKDLTKLLRPYWGEWVALSSDGQRVVGHGPTPSAALKQAHKKGERNPILMGAPERTWGSYIL
jgi:hypothetical protein